MASPTAQDNETGNISGKQKFLNEQLESYN